MVKQNRKKPRGRLLYFYLNDALHRSLKVNRSEDTIIAFNFVEGKRVAYNYSDVQKNKKHAYSISEVAKLINRHSDTIKRHIRSGDLTKPQQAYAIEDKTKLSRYYFTDADIRNMREFFKTVHIGRPRKDGEITASNIPSKVELEALLRNETVLYVKGDSGDFVPVWKQPEW
jgi:asparagine N-glycosylation enzyme membrane subunit Stt3